MIPTKAIIIYKSTGSYSVDYFLENRDIKNVGGKYLFMTPIPLASNVLGDIAKMIIKKDVNDMNIGGLIAPHLLYGSYKPGKSVVVWYRPAMARVLNFESHLKIKGSTSANCPATLYVVINDKLYVYALMTNERPGPKTKLYNAPFFNIYADGNVCLGTANVGKRRADTFEKEAERFERAFYMADQTGGVSENNCKTPLVTLWNRVIKSKGPFPSKIELKQHLKYKTMGEMINKLIEK